MNTTRPRIFRVLKTLVKIAGVFLLLALIAFFAFRNVLLHKAIDRVAAKLQSRYQLALTVREAGFSSLTGVSMQGISLVPNQRDTLLAVDSFALNIRLLYALFGDLRIEKVQIGKGYLQLSRKQGLRNFDFLLKDSTKQEETEKRETRTSGINFAKTAYRLIDGFLDHIPAHMELSGFDIRIIDEQILSTLSLTRFQQIDESIEATVTVYDNALPDQHWGISGTAEADEKKANFHVFNLDTGGLVFPYINQKFNLVAGFDSLHFELNEVQMDGDNLHIRGKSGITNFLVNHPKIAKKDVVLEDAGVDYHFILGEHYISLDSTTRVRFNQVDFRPFVALDMEKDTVFYLTVDIPKMPAQQFISSLPGGLFTHFKGMEVSGDFEYRLDFIYNENHPQDLVFESRLRKHNLAILRYGEANLAKLNGEFVYVPIERGRPQRPVFVGMINPYYMPINQISPYLQKCVLTTEDPSFYYHRGFIDEAFRQSIVKNIRKRKFARGASTISMQLVKNVFLTREKTLSRKLEEILLVYILENNRICAKERMMEVYLNIIEWGPDVYGIGEAASFYFNKSPAQLTLKECLFLATIIPRPKGFMWRFDKAGVLKPFADRQFGFLTNLMLRRNVLSPADTLVTQKPLDICGPAKNFIKISKDTFEQDSIIFDENGLLKNRDE